MRTGSVRSSGLKEKLPARPQKQQRPDGSSQPQGWVLAGRVPALAKSCAAAQLADLRNTHRVSGRRLRGVLSASPTPKDASSVIGHMLSRDEPDVLSATCELLHTLFDLQTEVTVKSLPPEPFGKGGDRGISARSLAEIWQIDLDETPQPPMVRFLAANVGAISAMLHVSDGETVANSGDSDALETIWDTQVLAFQKSQKAYRTADDGPQLICLEGALADDTAAALALAGDDVALIAYQPDHLAAMLASWHAITG